MIKTFHLSGWKCQQCDWNENIWLNLAAGAILCGRKFFDGAHENNHAVEHYYKTKISTNNEAWLIK